MIPVFKLQHFYHTSYFSTTTYDIYININPKEFNTIQHIIKYCTQVNVSITCASLQTLLALYIFQYLLSLLYITIL